MATFGRVWAGVALALAVGFGAEAAQAQCGSLSEAPGDVYDTVAAFVGPGVFPLADAKACEKFVKAVVSACHKAVSSALSCELGLAGSLGKLGKPICSELPDPQSCLDEVEASVAADRAQSEADAVEAHGICDVGLAGQARSDCLNGPI
jgi:hypothetical protein